MRPAIADAAKLLLDSRKQLRLNGVPIRAQIGRVDGVRIVIKRVGMLDLHHQNAREAGTDPLLVLLVGLLLLNVVIAREMKALRVVGLEVRIRWSSAKVVYVVNEVVMENGDRIVRVGMFVKSFRRQHDGREVHGSTPKLGQQDR